MDSITLVCFDVKRMIRAHTKIYQNMEWNHRCCDIACDKKQRQKRWDYLFRLIWVCDGDFSIEINTNERYKYSVVVAYGFAVLYKVFYDFGLDGIWRIRSDGIEFVYDMNECKRITKQKQNHNLIRWHCRRYDVKASDEHGQETRTIKTTI